jgi:hypothetical protein
LEPSAGRYIFTIYFRSSLIRFSKEKKCLSSSSSSSSHERLNNKLTKSDDEVKGANSTAVASFHRRQEHQSPHPIEAN